jgi:hypothetical protein
MVNTYIGDDPMKGTLRVAKPVLSRRELAKVLRGAWHHVIEQAEHDSASRFRVDRDVELAKGVISLACRSEILWCARIRSPCYSIVCRQFLARVNRERKR